MRDGFEKKGSKEEDERGKLSLKKGGREKRSVERRVATGELGA